MKIKPLLFCSIFVLPTVFASPEYSDTDLAECAAYYVEEERCGADAFDLHDVPMQALYQRKGKDEAQALFKSQQNTLRGYSALQLNGLYRYCLSLVLNTATDVQLQNIIANGNERQKQLQEGGYICKAGQDSGTD